MATNIYLQKDQLIKPIDESGENKYIMDAIDIKCGDTTLQQKITDLSEILD